MLDRVHYVFSPTTNIVALVTNRDELTVLINAVKVTFPRHRLTGRTCGGTRAYL